ncbi:hypothetical protein FPV67DRAFT_1197482 [Lyophyllum atratum]|nr:hypothetical protein FPV67DRAFT_1197482 [Lyophyllum atratum]
MFARVYLTALVATGAYMAAASPLVARTCSRTYEVVPGDTCDAISFAQNASTYQLLLSNPTVDDACDNLFVGQILCLGAVGRDCTTVRRVEDGDSCAVILEDAAITFDILRANNPNVDAECANIYPGEVLCVATAPVYVR